MDVAGENKNAQCETCAYYDYNIDTEQNECTVSFDEDEMARMAYGKKYDCPYYKFYDEYKFVRKQN
ncbi:MAG: hypothetical protein E7588_03235 [Ruminococcaceae bacterium]|nr:hypothetical protein [Oscillospiraceae bacterium]